MNFAKYAASLKWLEFVFTAGAVVGAVVGTIGGFSAGLMTGMLTAPKEGRQTRQDIADKIDNMLAEVKAKSEEFTQTVSAAMPTQEEENARVI